MLSFNEAYHSPMVHSLTVISTLLFMVRLPSIEAWNCESSCGDISLNYPFGSTWSCGSSAFQPYVNCSNGKLQFYTPTGTYGVKSIDYANNVMIVEDPQMSTCSSMQASGAFGLPIGAPFSFASYNKVALIGCSSTSSLYSKQSCDTSSDSQEICESIYENCQGISQVGIVTTSNNNYIQGSSSSCCVYANSLLQTAPYEIDLPLLQCTTFTCAYRIGSIHTPQSSWLFGIALLYNPSSPAQSSPNGGQSNPSCYACQIAEESPASFGPSPWVEGGFRHVPSFIYLYICVNLGIYTFVFILKNRSRKIRLNTSAARQRSRSKLTTVLSLALRPYLMTILDYLFTDSFIHN